MDQAYVKKVIICTKARRGNGTKRSPTRIITEIIDFKGNLIAESDHYSTNVETIKSFMRHHFKDIPEEEIDDAIYSYFIETNNDLSN